MQRDILDFFNGRNKTEGEALEPADAAGQSELKETLQAWNQASLDTSGFCPDVDCAWTQVRSKLRRTGAVKSLVYFYWAAASLVVLLGGYMLFTTIVSEPASIQSSVVNTEGKPMKFDLPDGSAVWLNQGSEVSYVDDNPREIQLKGEGYFKVANVDDKPFTVEVDGVLAKVLGTEFNVRQGKDITNISVVSGSVEVTALDKVVTLERHQQAEVVKSANSIKKTSFSDENFLAWKTGVLRFETTSLEKILVVMNKHYRSNIEVENEELEKCTLSLTLDNLTLDESLDVLATLLQGSVTRLNDGYIIKAATCDN